MLKTDPTMLLKYIKEEASSFEQQKVETWLNLDKKNEKILLQMARVYYAQQTKKRIEKRNVTDAYYNILKKIKKRQKRLFIKQMSAVAAVLLILFGVSAIWMLTINQSKNTQLYTFNSDTKKRCTEFILPDSTIVYLNSNSKLTYTSDFGEINRDVSLEGEGYFNVKHNAVLPFIVKAFDNKLRVRVLGTSFNIQAYEEDYICQATLIEGHINLEFQNKEGEEIVQQLVPSDKITYDIKSNQMSLDKVNTADELAWMDDRLVFKNTPLPEVVRKLAHFYNVKMEIKEEKLKQYTFTGVFENKPLSVVLDYLKTSSNISYQVEDVVNSRNAGETKKLIKLKNSIPET